MKASLLIIASTLFFSVHFINAQPFQSKSGRKLPDNTLMNGLDMDKMETCFILNVNPMDEGKKEKLNKIASNYRSRNRSVLKDLGGSMLSGGVAAVVNVIGTEILNLTKIRSKQKKAWMEMRQKECFFIDSLQSVKGQSDFYGRQSNYGPLDPSDMNFDGITLLANRDGKEVLKMVCHLDTTRLDHLFLHSKFYLVVDTIIFHPYRSFLPNLELKRPLSKKDYEIAKQQTKGEVDKSLYWATEDDIDYWNTISRFSFDEYKSPTINIKMDIFSSWINELVQVYQDVKLGTFTVNIPIDKKELSDSVYIYTREKALAEHRPIIDMHGDCFVVPRSYMPVAANNPSWGTGEYKMKVLFSENCRYNPKEGRSKDWHRDYKQLVRMQNNGKGKNEYLENVITTFRDNGHSILKATYTPALNALPSLMGIGTNVGGTTRMNSGPAADSSGGMPKGH